MFSGLEAQFAQSFIENNRWVAYLKGLGISFEVTLGALCLGVILGVLVAVIRTHTISRLRAIRIYFWAYSMPYAKYIQP